MKDLVKFKIPTLLGFGIILSGIIAGVYLVLREQTFISQASPDVTPQNIIVSDITDNSAVVSWQTSIPVASFLSFGQKEAGEQTVLDDRDAKTPIARSIHYVTIKNLLPQTVYKFKITSGKTQSEINQFTTATPVTIQAAFQPVTGTIIDGDKPLSEGIVYLSVAGATTLSSIVKTSGNFLIPLSQIRKADLSDIFPLTADTIIKLTAVAKNGQTTALFKLKDSSSGLPPIKLGQNLDLTDQTTPLPTPASLAPQADQYDLNGDGSVNSVDNAVILQNFGRSPKNKKADLNKDGVVDQKDVDLLLQNINR